MGRKVRRVPYSLDPKEVDELPEGEIRAVIRGAEDIISDEHLAEFDAMIAIGLQEFDMEYLKDRNRRMIMQLLDKVAATGDLKYIPSLEAWAEVDYKKVRERINYIIRQLEGGKWARGWKPSG